MSTMPVKADLTGSVNQGQFKTAFNNAIDFWNSYATSYGLGTNAVTATVDWNNYVTTGFFKGNSLANAPISTGDYIVQVISHDASNVTQTARGYMAGNWVTYTRLCNYGTWTAWKQLATTDSPALTGTPTITNASTTDLIITGGATGYARNLFKLGTGAGSGQQCNVGLRGDLSNSYVIEMYNGTSWVKPLVATADGKLTIAGQIAFPATQNPSTDANTLDDYEEGTFTPVCVGGTTAGTGTYSIQSGKYTKIGNVVNFHIAIAWSVHTGAGNLYITGLPFVSNGYGSPCSMTADGLTFTGDLCPFVPTNSSYIAISQAISNANSTLLTMDSAVTGLTFRGSYHV